MKKILLTGGSGFIGRNIKEYLADRGYTVLAPSSSELNLLNFDDVSNYLSSNLIDVVIHTAKTRTYGNDDYNPLDKNMLMFLSLERCSLLYEKMIYFGSGAEYNVNLMKSFVRETDFGKYVPTDEYGIGKYLMRRISSSKDNIYDLCIFGVYGKYEDWSRRFISSNIVSALKEKTLLVRNNALFDYMYINDLVKIVEWFIENKPNYLHYNVCTGKEMELVEIAKIISNELCIKCNIQVDNYEITRRYSGNNCRLCEEITNLQLTPLSKAINEMISYYSTLINEF